MIQSNPDKANVEFWSEKSIWHSNLELTYWDRMFEAIPYTDSKTGKRSLKLKRIDTSVGEKPVQSSDSG